MGELDDRFAAFKGMALKRQAGTTVLTGPVRDQADLQGLLQRVAGLGLTLLRANAPRGLGAAMTAELTTSHTLRQRSSNDARS